MNNHVHNQNAGGSDRRWQREDASLCRLARSVLVAAAVVTFLAAQPACALPRIERYLSVTVTPSELDLGTVPQPGVYDSPSELKVHVTANCTHGGVVASVTPLVRAGGGTLDPERVSVKLPGTGNYVPMTNPVPVTGPMDPGVFDVILKFRLTTDFQVLAGTYTGTITITCAGAP